VGVADLAREPFTDAIRKFYLEALAHSRLRNSKRTKRSLSTGAPFWRAGWKRHCDRAREDALVSWWLPSANLTWATAPVRSTRATNSTLELSGISSLGTAGSGCSRGLAGTKSSPSWEPVKILRKAWRIPEDGAG